MHCYLLLIVFASSARLFGTYQYDISICTIFQNEAPYLKEWIDYHRGIGVDHFVLYNNDSKDNFEEVLSHYINAGIVEVHYWPDLWPETFFGVGCQPAAYRDGLSRLNGKSKWVCFIDTDEFILPMQEENLKICLKNHYEEHFAIYVNWLLFGTSGVKVVPGEPLLPHLTKCASKDHPWNGIGKTIVRPEAIENLNEIHFFSLRPGFRYSDGDASMGGYDHQRHDKYLRINYYTFRDENFLWTTKLERYLNWIPSESHWKEEFTEKNKQYSVTEDYFILKFLR